MSNFSFTVYAPQRSGTNYLETLIASNFSDVGNCLITDDSYAWKHTTDTETVSYTHLTLPTILLV